MKSWISHSFHKYCTTVVQQKMHKFRHNYIFQKKKINSEKKFLIYKNIFFLQGTTGTPLNTTFLLNMHSGNSVYNVYLRKVDMDYKWVSDRILNLSGLFYTSFLSFCTKPNIFTSLLKKYFPLPSLTSSCWFTVIYRQSDVGSLTLNGFDACSLIV